MRLGRSIALALGRAGADIALHYWRSADEAAAAAGEIRAIGRRVELFQADLARPDRIETMFAAVGEAFGRLDAGRTCHVRRVAEDHGLADVIALLFANDFGLGETARGCVGHLWFLCLSVRLDPVPDAPNPVVGRRM